MGRASTAAGRLATRTRLNRIDRPPRRRLDLEQELAELDGIAVRDVDPPDDAVEIRCRGEAILIGTCPELTRHHVEIRGLGLVNVTELFGVS